MDVSANVIGNVQGKQIIAYTMKNNNGMQMTVLNLGCIVTEILTPDKDGNFENIVAGFDHVEDYLSNPAFFGAIIGRVAGRIKGATFQLDDEIYKLAENEGPNHLHGGVEGFHKKIWEGKILRKENQIGVEFTYLSKDGEENYPGNVTATVTYLLNDKNEWTQMIEGKTDKKTLLNLTNHSYFNLSGNFKRDIRNHELKMDSTRFLELDENFIPTGNMLEVDGTVFDLRRGRELREVFQSNHPQIELTGNGFDHPFMLKEDASNISLSEKKSGRVLTVETNQPSVVIYTSNNLGDDLVMQGGKKSSKHIAICLETQAPPDAIHHSNFPSIILQPGERYYSVTRYKFGVQV